MINTGLMSRVAKFLETLDARGDEKVAVLAILAGYYVGEHARKKGRPRSDLDVALPIMVAGISSGGDLGYAADLDGVVAMLNAAQGSAGPLSSPEKPGRLRPAGGRKSHE